MNVRSRGLGVLSEALIVLVSFLGGDPRALRGARGVPDVPPRSCRRPLLCVVVVILTLYYAEMYEYRTRRRTELFLRLGQCMAVAAVTLAVIFFAVPGLEVGRGIFGFFVLFAWGGLLSWRLAVLWTWGAMSALGDRVLILGTGVSASKVAREMLKRSPAGLPRARVPDRARGGGGPRPREPERPRDLSATCRDSRSRSTSRSSWWPRRTGGIGSRWTSCSAAGWRGSASSRGPPSSRG